MKPTEVRAVSEAPEGLNMLIGNKPAPQDINLTSTIKVEQREEGKAVITVPSELRLTPELVALINQALQAQGLELVHMNISSKHVQELKDIPNVVLGGERTAG